jgi:hypothetical protein
MIRNVITALLTCAALAGPLLTGRLPASVVLVDSNGFGQFLTIQEGIDAVAGGDTVLVRGGLYRGEGNRDLDLGGRNILLQGLALAGEPDWETPLVDCQNAARAFAFGAAIDSTTVIDAFRFIRGSATTGGAIDCWGGSPIIRNCLFEENWAVRGGAIQVSGGAAKVRNCEFRGNTADDTGGAVSVSSGSVAVVGSTFHDNTAADGGALWFASSEPVVRSCTIAGNSSFTAGGITLEGSGGTIERCIVAFSTNGSGIEGGDPEIFHCYVFGNEGGDALPGDHHDNESEDPLLCDLAEGTVSLCSNSPCLAANNPWGLLIGSEAQGCGDCTTTVSPASWSAIKALYR